MSVELRIMLMLAVLGIAVLMGAIELLRDWFDRR